MARKKWRTTYPDGKHDDFTSERATYEWVGVLRRQWKTGHPADGTPTLTVLVDEGHGWGVYEDVDFTKEPR